MSFVAKKVDELSTGLLLGKPLWLQGDGKNVPCSRLQRTVTGQKGWGRGTRQVKTIEWQEKAVVKEWTG
jgi:hypothetical protein